MVLSKSKPDVEWEEVPVTSRPVFLFVLLFCFISSEIGVLGLFLWFLLLKPQPFDIVRTYYGLTIVCWLELD